MNTPQTELETALAYLCSRASNRQEAEWAIKIEREISVERDLEAREEIDLESDRAQDQDF